MRDEDLKTFRDALILAIVYIVIWLIFCGAAAIVMWCFEMTFSWKVATGAFIICLILRWIFSAAKSDKKE